VLSDCYCAVYMCQAGDEQQSTKIGGGTLSRSSIAGNVNHQGSEMMSEMERRLHERRAKIDQVPPANNSVCVLLYSVFC